MQGLLGLANMLENLAKVNALAIDKSRAALIKSALKIQGDSQNLVPVVTSNLKNSAFVYAINFEKRSEGIEKENPNTKKVTKKEVVKNETRNKPSVGIGYSANYAIFVHERLDLKHKKGQAKFLEAALKSNIGEIRKNLQGILK